MEILALYTDSEALETALAAGARHLAATLEGFCLIYQVSSSSSEPEGWAGFSCARDAENASQQLTAFRKRIEASERPLQLNAPSEPARIWARAAGGLFGFPLQQGGKTRGVAIVGCPGPWPRMRNAETESILRQLTLVLDHHAVSCSSPQDDEPSDELLRLSEQLLAHDMEDIKRAESHHQATALEHDLIEKISSELRAPFNRILEQVISVLANEHENLSETGRATLREALDEGHSLAQLIQNILDLWRIKNDKMPVELQSVNLDEVVQEALFNVRDSLGADVTIEKRIPAPLPRIRMDLGKLNQILFHILDNAAKFTRRGRIRLELALVEGDLRCAVTDTGVGISEEHQDQVFDEFYQVDGSLGCKRRGTGLGLTLARSLVEKLGGTMSLSSEIGRGSCVTFTLPVSVLTS